MKTTSIYSNGRFRNKEFTRLSLNESEGMGSVLRELFFNKRNRFPKRPIPVEKFDKAAFDTAKEGFAWFGHSTLLMKLAGKTIVFDPVFGRPSPFSFMGPGTFPLSHAPTVADLPDTIDLVLITHDHYDHLEKKTIKKIHARTQKFLVPLKLKDTLVRWGVPESKVVEFDWHTSKKVYGLTVIFTPTRHFSGRGLFDRNKTLWGGWIIHSKSKKIYISGDGGYSDEFQNIGEEYGPFDLTFVENGQYNRAWEDVHLFPEEAVQVGKDSKSKVLFPIHWGKYDLSVHTWDEPIERFTQEARKKRQRFVTHPVGKLFNIGSTSTHNWWKA